MSGCDLGGLGVLVTRAAHQAGPLAEAIAARNGRPVRFPALVIEPTHAACPQQPTPDLLIFISPNAVEQGLAAGLPQAVKIAAVGRATARQLSQAGLAPDIVPAAGHDSEALLAEPLLADVTEQRIVIVRGEGGRPLLADELRRRGAQVDYWEVYRRALPAVNPDELLRSWPDAIDVVSVTSSDLLDNLCAMLDPHNPSVLRRTPLLVISSRMAGHARERGFNDILLAEGPHESQIIERLCRHVAGHPPDNPACPG